MVGNPRTEELGSNRRKCICSFVVGFLVCAYYNTTLCNKVRSLLRSQFPDDNVSISDISEMNVPRRFFYF